MPEYGGYREDWGNPGECPKLPPIRRVDHSQPVPWFAFAIAAGVIGGVWALVGIIRWCGV